MDLTVMLLLTAIVLGIAVVAGVFLASRKKGFKASDQVYFSQQWVKVMAEADVHPAHAVLSADKLLDLALRKRGKLGSVGEMLKHHGILFSDLNGLWAAHKLRNTIAHQVGFIPSDSQARQAVSGFKRALEDLGLRLSV